MKLIDAGALKNYLQRLMEDDWNQRVCTSWADAYREFVDIVDEQPTIEPLQLIAEMLKMNYCPNCGADMRGKNNEKTT